MINIQSIQQLHCSRVSVWIEAGPYGVAKKSELY